MDPHCQGHEPASYSTRQVLQQYLFVKLAEADPKIVTQINVLGALKVSSQDNHIIFESDAAFHRYVDTLGDSDEATTLRALWDAVHTVPGQKVLTTADRLIHELSYEIYDDQFVPDTADFQWLVDNQRTAFRAVNQSGGMASKTCEAVSYLLKSLENPLQEIQTFQALSALQERVTDLLALQGRGTHWNAGVNVKLSLVASRTLVDADLPENVTYLVRFPNRGGTIAIRSANSSWFRYSFWKLGSGISRRKSGEIIAISTSPSMEPAGSSRSRYPQIKKRRAPMDVQIAAANS